MQFTRLDHPVKLALQPDHLIVDGAAVGLKLGFPRAADKAKATALAFKVGPGAHQPCALIAERRKFDLQHPFAGAGAVGEDLQDQRGPVKQLDPPLLFQIALLHGRHRAIDQHKVNLRVLEAGFQFINLAGTDQGAGMDTGKLDDIRAADVKFGQGGGKGHGLGQPVFGQAAGLGGFQGRMQHIGARWRCGRVTQPLARPFGQKVSLILHRLCDQSSPS